MADVTLQTQIDTLVGLRVSLNLEMRVVVPEEERAAMQRNIHSLEATIRLLEAMSDIREPY